MGMTFAILYILGKQLIEKDLFMSSERELEVLSLINWRIFVGILFGLTLLLLFKDFIMILISSRVVADITKFQGLDVLNSLYSSFWKEGCCFEAFPQ